MPDRPILAALADRVGIMPDYVNHNGTERRFTPDGTRQSLLAAMGFDASSEQSAQAAIDSLDHSERERIIAPVHVVTSAPTPVSVSASNQQARNGESGTVSLRLPRGVNTSWDWVLELHEESGRVHRTEGRVTPHSDIETVELPLPARPKLGYHRIRATLRASDSEYHGDQRLIVAPASCFTTTEAFADRRLFGLWTNLYSIRSHNNWGVGDLGDLRELLSLANEVGAGFVGINPLHVNRNHGPDISPYRPVSRLYRNGIYLDLSAIPELNHCEEAQHVLDSSQFVSQLHTLRSAKDVNYVRIDEIKRNVLQSLHRAFVKQHRDKPTARGQSYAAYLETEGRTLTDFATFQALDNYFRCFDPPLASPRRWPVEYRDPRSTAVETFRRDHADEIDYHCYLQFELDRQLNDIAGHAQSLGLPIGLYQDLAVGASPDGSDCWSFPQLFVDGVSVGAPPDDLGPEGQNWDLPPINPLRLRESGYDYWIRLLRGVFAHAGAVRIDHIMGLFRQFWIPANCPGSAGAYVRYPADDLFAILALESRRHNALVIGEDLGTVPAGFEEILERWGILSTRVLYFERDHNAEFRSPSQYSKRAMVTVNTHDLAPLKGYWEGIDLEVRRGVGQIATDEQLAEAYARRSCERNSLNRALHREGLAPEHGSLDYADRCAAVHAFIARSPAPLIGISLDDLAGETEPMNLPGVDPTRYPCWTRRMRIPLEDLRSLPAATLTFAAVHNEKRSSQPPGGVPDGDS